MKLCKCGKKIKLGRYKLGYNTCVNCGEHEARKEVERRKSCVAPLYNKGAYQYIGSLDQAINIGRK
jgi:hypothetical protein